MGYEPGAARRLRLQCATSRDSQLHSILGLLEDDPMPSTPRELVTAAFDLSTFEETAEDGPCDVPSATRSLGGQLDSLTAGLSAGETAMALLALSEHAGALRLVWEAHARGAITLPPSVARRVVHARRSVPSFLSRDVVTDVSTDIGTDMGEATATVVVMPTAPSIR
jgi:hypothetical protein